MRVCSKCGAPADFHVDTAASEGDRCADCIAQSEIYVSSLGDEIGECIGEEVGEEVFEYEEGEIEE